MSERPAAAQPPRRVLCCCTQIQAGERIGRLPAARAVQSAGRAAGESAHLDDGCDGGVIRLEELQLHVGDLVGFWGPWHMKGSSWRQRGRGVRGARAAGRAAQTWPHFCTGTHLRFHPDQVGLQLLLVLQELVHRGHLSRLRRRLRLLPGLRLCLCLRRLLLRRLAPRQRRLGLGRRRLLHALVWRTRRRALSALPLRAARARLVHWVRVWALPLDLRAC